MRQFTLVLVVMVTVSLAGCSACRELTPAEHIANCYTYPSNGQAEVSAGAGMLAVRCGPALILVRQSTDGQGFEAHDYYDKMFGGDYSATIVNDSAESEVGIDGGWNSVKAAPSREPGLLKAAIKLRVADQHVSYVIYGAAEVGGTPILIAVKSPL